MADIIFIAILIAFFALSVVFVRACDRIIGADTASDAANDHVDTADRVAA